MNTCVTLADIDEAVSCQDLDNLAGIVQEIIYGFWEDVATWPDLPAPSATGGDTTAMTLTQAGAWSGDIAMKSGTRAYKLVVQDNSGEFTMTDQGEAGGESVLYELSVVRTKMNATIFGFENATRGRRMFFIVTDKNGVSYLMGDRLNAARKVTADATTTGAQQTDLNKVPMKFQYACPRKLVYTGDKTTILTVATTPST